VASWVSIFDLKWERQSRKSISHVGMLFTLFEIFPHRATYIVKGDAVGMLFPEDRQFHIMISLV